MKILDMKRQGECLFIEVDGFDDDESGYRAVAPEGSHLVVGHSETGHHHVIDLARSQNAQLLISKTNELIGRLEVGSPVEVKHLRAFDTHPTVPLDAGKYVVRWRREMSPEGMRRVED